jgi:hypothetical protein
MVTSAEHLIHSGGNVLCGTDVVAQRQTMQPGLEVKEGTHEPNGGTWAVPAPWSSGSQVGTVY